MLRFKMETALNTVKQHYAEFKYSAGKWQTRLKCNVQYFVFVTFTDNIKYIYKSIITKPVFTYTYYLLQFCHLRKYRDVQTQQKIFHVNVILLLAQTEKRQTVAHKKRQTVAHKKRQTVTHKKHSHYHRYRQLLCCQTF